MGVDRTTGFGSTIMKLLKPLFLTPEQGAYTALYLALNHLSEQDNGAYYVKGKKKQTSAMAEDQQLALRLWQISLDIVRPWLTVEGIPPEMV